MEICCRSCHFHCLSLDGLLRKNTAYMQQVIIQISKNVLKTHNYTSRYRFWQWLLFLKLLPQSLIVFWKSNLYESGGKINKGLSRSDGTMILWVIHRLPDSVPNLCTYHLLKPLFFIFIRCLRDFFFFFFTYLHN